MLPAAEELPAAAVQARRHARASGLVYVSDTEPGIRRKRRGSHFHYLAPNGRPVTAARTLDRIRRLAIPPAYTDVWICREPRGHLQATGRDARGASSIAITLRGARHATAASSRAWSSSARSCRGCAGVCGRIWRCRACRRTRSLAAIVRLLDETLLRVGNEEYARSNKSYGLTTLRDHHVKFLQRRKRVLLLQGQERPHAGSGARRSPAGAHHSSLPAVARSTTVPVRRRRGPAPAGRLRHGQRLSARGHGRQRRRIHRQGFPHLGRYGARDLVPGVPRCRANA